MLKSVINWALILASALLPALGFAAGSPFDCVPGKTVSQVSAREILDRVQSRYSQVTSLHAQFDQDSFMAALEVSEHSAGQVWFVKPGLMKWSYESPDKQTFLIRDKTMWLYQAKENQVLIDSLQDILISDLPVAFLVGLGNLRQDFSLQSACETKVGTLLELLPSSKGSQAKGGNKDRLDKFFLLVDAQNLPRGAKVRDLGGNTTAIALSATETDVKPAADLFAPSFPAGADINDHRLAKAD